MGDNRVGFAEGTIRTSARRVVDARAELRRLGRELHGEIGQLQGRWAGAGAQAFGVLHQTWDDKQRAIVAALDRFEVSLVETEMAMTSSDETAAASVNSIRARMEGVRQF